MPLVLTDIQAGMQEAWEDAQAAATAAAEPNKKFVEDNSAGGDLTAIKEQGLPVSGAQIDKAAAIAFGLKAGIVIDAYIKSADVLPGIAVAVTGSPSAQAGATTAPGEIA
tara:strand:- start:777 stop:1106 length:330 start_codon:yes stop_codon:yes gene_type:complete